MAEKPKKELARTDTSDDKNAIRLYKIFSPIADLGGSKKLEDAYQKYDLTTPDSTRVGRNIITGLGAVPSGFFSLIAGYVVVSNGTDLAWGRVALLCLGPYAVSQGINRVHSLYRRGQLHNQFNQLEGPKTPLALPALEEKRKPPVLK